MKNFWNFAGDHPILTFLMADLVFTTVHNVVYNICVVKSRQIEKES
jgi:hypothetical protein